MEAVEADLASAYAEVSTFQYTEGLKMLDKAPPQPGDKILDVGCGTGEITAHLAQLVGPVGEVVGIDPDVDRIQIALNKFGSVGNLTLVEGSTEGFPHCGEEYYDYVYSNHVIHWVHDKETALKNAYRSLKPGGHLVWNFLFHKKHDRPSSNVSIRPFLSEELFKNLMGQTNIMECKKMVEIAKNVGFSSVNGEEITYFTNYDDRNHYMTWYMASTHGLIKAKDVNWQALDEYEFPLTEDGKISVEWDLGILTAKK